MKKLLLIGALLLTGCASFAPELERAPLEVKRAIITIETGDSLPFNNHGEARWKDIDGVRHCTIYLKDYPWGLGHEVDHCFRGKWHGDADNSDDRG